MILLDTGYFIALFTPTDELHARATSWSHHVNERLIVTEYVLVETVNFFSRPKDRASVHQIIDHVQANPFCEIVPASAELFQAGLELHRERPDKDWSLTDCISFVVMNQRSVKRALAYDHNFEQAGFEALLRQPPPIA